MSANSQKQTSLDYVFVFTVFSRKMDIFLLKNYARTLF